MKFDRHIFTRMNSEGKQGPRNNKNNFYMIDKDTLLLLYKGLVRPILEYGNVIWAPNSKSK